MRRKSRGLYPVKRWKPTAVDVHRRRKAIESQRKSRYLSGH